MAKYFLGSVGTAEAFKKVNGKLEKAFVSKTLTDSGLNISTTKDDVRAGTGAPIQFSFYHDPSVEITLTDVMFERAYVEAQLGTEFKQNAENGSAYTNEQHVGSAGSLTLDHVPAKLNMGCGNAAAYVWFKDADDTLADWKIVEAEGQTVSDASILADHNYCVRYAYDNPDAYIAKISSTMIPEELFLIITAPIFAGDSCSASNGKKAGTITFEVPRFKLNGAQEFSMNMSSNQTMSLAGIALASESGCDITDSQLLRIIEVLDDEAGNLYDLDELIPDEDYLQVGVTPVVYGLRKDGSVVKILNSALTFVPALTNEGKFSEQGTTTITLTGTEITDTVTVAAAE